MNTTFCNWAGEGAENLDRGAVKQRQEGVLITRCFLTTVSCRLASGDLHGLGIGWGER